MLINNEKPNLNEKYKQYLNNINQLNQNIQNNNSINSISFKNNNNLNLNNNINNINYNNNNNINKNPQKKYNQKQTNTTTKKKKNKKKWYPGQIPNKNIKKQKNLKSYTTDVYHTNKPTFNLNTTNPNSNGLFDPNLKKHELDSYPKNNYVMNRVNNSTNLSKYSKENKEELLRLLKVPPPKINSNLNLNINFDKYEAMIKSLEDQIDYERMLRKEEHKNYIDKKNEYEEYKIKTLTGNYNNYKNKKVGKRAKSAFRVYYPKNDKKFLNNNNKYNEKIKKINKDKSMSKMNAEDIIRRNARLFAKSAEKMIDKDFEKIYKNLEEKPLNLILSKYKKKSNNNKIKNNNNNINDKNKNINNNNDNNDNNNEIINENNKSNDLTTFDNNNLIKNENVSNYNNFYEESEKLKNKINKYENYNEIVDEYNKEKDIMYNQIENTINKYNDPNYKPNNNNNNNNIKKEKILSKNNKEFQTKKDKINEEIIDDLLYELVYELEEIEKVQNKIKDEQNFKNFVTNYIPYINDIKEQEINLIKKLSNNNNDNTNDNVIKNEPKKNNNRYENNLTTTNENIKDDIINPFDINFNKKLIPLKTEEGYNNNIDEIDNYLNNKCHYKNILDPTIKYKIEENKKNFYNYMKLKGSFYFPNIFKIYDDTVTEECNRILDEELNYSVKQVNDFVGDLYKEEIIKIHSNK